MKWSGVQWARDGKDNGLASIVLLYVNAQNNYNSVSATDKRTTEQGGAQGGDLYIAVWNIFPSRFDILTNIA